MQIDEISIPGFFHYLFAYCFFKKQNYSTVCSLHSVFVQWPQTAFPIFKHFILKDTHTQHSLITDT